MTTQRGIRMDGRLVAVRSVNVFHEKIVEQARKEAVLNTLREEFERFREEVGEMPTSVYLCSSDLPTAREAWNAQDGAKHIYYNDVLVLDGVNVKGACNLECGRIFMVRWDGWEPCAEDSEEGETAMTE